MKLGTFKLGQAPLGTRSRVYKSFIIKYDLFGTVYRTCIIKYNLFVRVTQPCFLNGI